MTCVMFPVETRCFWGQQQGHQLLAWARSLLTQRPLGQKWFSWSTAEMAWFHCRLKPVSPKGNQPWIFVGRADAEAEAPIPWPPDVKSQLIGKDPHAGKDWGQEEKRVTEDEMVAWHHWFNGHEFEQAPGDSEGQRSLVCCSYWGHKQSDMTEWLNNYHHHQLLERWWSLLDWWTRSCS